MPPPATTAVGADFDDFGMDCCMDFGMRVSPKVIDL